MKYMKKEIMLIILAAVIISGCDVVVECQDISDCENKPHAACNGTWSCVENECWYNCGGLFNATPTPKPEAKEENESVEIKEVVVNITRPSEEKKNTTPPEIKINQTVVNQTKPANITPPWKSSGNMTVSFIDVDYGDAMLIITPKGRSMVIDGGSNEAGPVVVNYMRSFGIYLYLDYLIASNSEEEHVGGLDSVLYNMLREHTVHVYSSGLDPKTSSYAGFIAGADQEDHKLIKKDTKISLNDTSVEVELLTPYEKGWLLNPKDNSIIVRLTYHNVSFLFTGDCRKSCEERIMGKDLKADILKVADHGHENATSVKFLEKVNPKVAVISTGDEDETGLPHKELLDRLESKDIQVYRTDTEGTIVIRTDGVRYWISTEKK